MGLKKKSKLSFMSRIITIACIVTFFSLQSFNINAQESTFEKVKSIIRNYYIEEVSQEVLNSSSIEELIEALNDPYTQYFTKEEYSGFMNSINMKIYGIGIHVKMIEEGVLVESVIESSGAEEAGILDGDIITKAGGVSLEGMAVGEATDYIKGENGTKVKVEVKRGEKLLNFEVERRELKLPSAEGEVIDDNIGYIIIRSFAEDTENYFNKELKELEKANAARYIIDLRFNGGGYMDTAQKIAGHFIGDKTALITKNRFMEKNLEAIKPEIIIDKPVIFLVNEYSASASEILAAAVKDNKKAYFIGVNTYGKGVAQSIYEFNDGSALKWTTQEFISPLRKPINKIGIKPDLELDKDGKRIDTLGIAALLSGKCKNSIDKSGYIKIEHEVNDKKWKFEIDIKEAKKVENYPYYKLTLDKLFSQGEIFLGNKSGWKLIDKNNYKNSNDFIKLLYSDYKEIKELKEIPLDKKFTVTFNEEVDVKAFGANNIEIVDVVTGKRLKYNLSQLDSHKIRVIPEEKLRANGEYFLILNNNIKGKNNERLKQGVITTVETIRK